MNPRSDSHRRISATVFDRADSTSRARGFVARSRYRWRCRRSMSWSPERLSGHGRRDLASSSKPSTRIDSSPVRVVTTSPQAPTQSPTPRPRKPSKRSPRRAAWPKSWILPPQSPRSANATLPWPRVVWMRPATRWISPVAAPGSSEPYLAISSPGVEVRSKRSGAPSDGAGIALVHEAEAHEGEVGLMADGAVARGEDPGRKPTGGKHRSLPSEGLGHPLDHPVHHRRCAEEHPGADRLHRGAPNDVLRCNQLHLLDLGGHPGEGVGGDLQAGGDGTPQVLAALPDSVEGRGRPEVDDDQGRRDEVEGRDGVDDAIRAHLPRVVGFHRQPGPDARRHHHGFEMEVPGNHFPEGGGLRRDNAAEHHPGHLAGEGEADEGEELLEDQGELVGGPARVGRGAPLRDQALLAEDADMGLRGAGVDGEQHGSPRSPAEPGGSGEQLSPKKPRGSGELLPKNYGRPLSYAAGRPALA